MKIRTNYSSAYLEYAVVSQNYLLACSFFDRSEQVVRSVSSSMANGGLVTITDDGGREIIKRTVGWKVGAESFIIPMRLGKERVTHALCVSKVSGTEGLLTTEERKLQDVYNYLMEHFKLPLLPEWTEEILKKISESSYRYSEKLKVYASYDNEMYFPLGNDKVNVNELIYVPIDIQEKTLEEFVSSLLKEKKIWISKNPQKPLSFASMDEYFSIYGSGVMENLKKTLHPVSEHTDTMEYAALKKLRLYPQQISIDSGVINYFRKKKGRYALFNCGMGTGKTIMGATAVDGYYNSLAMDKHDASLADVLKNPSWVKYRNVVMCPPHLVEKWVKEINTQIPHAKAIALTDFKQLLEIKANGRERVGKEWYVMSKDFGKLSYMEAPTVRSIKKKEAVKCVCSECEREKPFGLKATKCQTVGCEGHYVASGTGNIEVGFTCPSCGVLLSTPPRKCGDGYKFHLGPYDFTDKNKWNEVCWCCNEPLWQPYVRNIGPKKEKKRTWHRVTHYSNKARKAKKTVWLLGGTEDRYFAELELEMLNDLGDEGGVRKYAPASYIKKQLKGFFDFALFDEVHQYKGGTTAQGNAMHSLIKASKYQLGLTGTIAGGVATHLFSLLFRLEPKRMLEKGFTHCSEVAFAERYGTIETVFEATESYRSNKMSKGRQLVSPKVKPGISPKVFTDFLMDRAVFLDLSDMSSFLPPLKEKVVITDTEPEILQEYTRVVDKLREEAQNGNFGLLSSMLQFSLSYGDKPYGVSPILNPKTGKPIVAPADLSYLIENGQLLNKERELVNIVNRELSENRNLVIFAEYTNSEETCVTERLKEILEHNCGLYGQVQIIKASTPEAIKREAWLHDKAAEGIRVFITNPKILETGVDLCFNHKGVDYNYETLIFFQMGYNMFTLAQASRRHYRLCQRKECRTYYMAAGGTVQPAVIKLIAAKQVATSAIQGKFSEEGLAAMAEGVDTRVLLAKALSEKDTENKDELQQMFDVLADSTSDGQTDYVPMSTYYELVGEEEPTEPVPSVPFMPDLAFGAFDVSSSGANTTMVDNDFFMFGMSLFDLDITAPIKSVPVCEQADFSKYKEEPIKVKGAGDSFSIFDLVG